jgi:ATP-dependent Clp protease ATP-binding subunit ClpX
MKAIKRNTGARGLRSIVEALLMEVMYELPSEGGSRKIVITKDTVNQGIPPAAEDLKKSA